MNRQGTITAVLFLIACVGAFAPRAHAQTPAGYGYVSSELLSLGELTAALPVLAAHKVALVLDWPSTEVASAARFEFVKAATKAGVTVRPWLLLPMEGGLWANSTNAERYSELARTLIDNWRAAGLAPTMLVVDMEMPIDRARQFAAVVATGDTNRAAAFLRANTNRTQYANATRIYRALVDYAHGKGFKVEVSTWPQVLDDYLDGDDGLRQGLNIPLASIGWDLITFQAYRTLNDALLNGTAPRTTSYYVYDYGSRAKGLFGARGGVIVGMTDPGDLAPNAPVYKSAAQLREDIDAAAWAGVTRANLGAYNLRGMLRRAPAAQWFPSASPISLPPLPDLATLLVRLNVAALDLSL